ncbi:MAG TPA: hypothetical protein VL132_24400 [Planctomycetaceae bacterium]|nr:hypothetical protein [Planctomycetaceae bacterium]
MKTRQSLVAVDEIGQRVKLANLTQHHPLPMGMFRRQFSRLDDDTVAETGNGFHPIGHKPLRQPGIAAELRAKPMQRDRVSQGSVDVVFAETQRDSD